MLSTAQLLSLRGTMEGSFPSTAQVQRYTPASDGAGGETDTPGVMGSYACRVVGATAQDRQEGGRPVSVTVWQILLPYTADVGPKDQLLVDGATYEVVDTDAGESEPVCLRVNALKVL
jgi:hypothetical protein